MQSVNKVILVGSVGKDPQERAVGDAKPVTFSLATNEAWTNKKSGERQERTQWHTIVVWNEALAEVAMKYVKKGSKIYIEGQLETRSYGNDRDVRYISEVVMRPFHSHLVLLDKPDRPAGQPAQRRDRGEEPRGTR